MVSEALIREMTDEIVRAEDPRQVILFGSAARGDTHEHSDVDFLIVSRLPIESDRNRLERMTRLWRMLARFPVSKDILLYGHDEIERWRDSRNHVIGRAIREGRVLHDRP